MVNRLVRAANSSEPLPGASCLSSGLQQKIIAIGASTGGTEALSTVISMEKLRILSDAAKYDAACTSSGVDKKAGRGGMGSASAAGICHSFAGDGRCISLLKVLLTNACVYNCAYCVNRCSNDVPRAAFASRELAELTMYIVLIILF